MKKVLKIQGMHCASCEFMIESKFKEIDGVEAVKVNYSKGKAELLCSKEISSHEFQKQLNDTEYRVSDWFENKPESGAVDSSDSSDSNAYVEAGAIFLVIMASYLVLKRLDLIPNLGFSENMSYGFIFLLGLVAAMSTCMAVSGGLLLALAGKYNEGHPNMSGLQKFKPHLYFNLGRILSYTFFGGMLGLIGSTISFSPLFNGILTIVVSFVMIFLAFQMLNIFPWTRKFHFKMPKFIGHKINDAAKDNLKGAPFILGSFTFFLPCGFTQALQLYVLSGGDFEKGALTMLAFSLGTLPALLSLGLVSSFAKGDFQKYFIKFVGVFILMLGVFNIKSGLQLTGINLFESENVRAESVEVSNGVQIVEMKIDGLEYIPHTFTVKKDIPVEWRIDASEAIGCGAVILVRKLGIAQYLTADKLNIIKFTPEEAGEIPFSCSMGMTTPGSAFFVE